MVVWSFSSHDALLAGLQPDRADFHKKLGLVKTCFCYFFIYKHLDSWKNKDAWRVTVLQSSSSPKPSQTHLPTHEHNAAGRGLRCRAVSTSHPRQTDCHEPFRELDLFTSPSSAPRRVCTILKKEDRPRVWKLHFTAFKGLCLLDSITQVSWPNVINFPPHDCRQSEMAYSPLWHTKKDIYLWCRYMKGIVTNISSKSDVQVLLENFCAEVYKKLFFQYCTSPDI